MLAPIELLPAELLHQILEFLDIPDLYALTRTSPTLRRHSSSPFLHQQRLQRTKLHILPDLLSRRPSIIQLRRQHILLLPQDTAQQKVARQLASVALKHRLAHRPAPEDLVKRGVLPAVYCRQSTDMLRPGERAHRNEQGLDMLVAPGLVGTAQRLERERVRDVIKSFMEKRVRLGSE